MLLALLAAAEFTLLAGAGSRGERRVEAVAHAASDDYGVTLGAASSEGPQAALRQQLTLGAESGLLKGEVRVIPGLLVGGEAGVHFESVSLVLGGRTAALGREQLRAAGARIEVDFSEHAGASAEAWALQLDSPRRDPWASWGNATLDWAQRWEASGWLSFDVADAVSLAPSLAFSQPAEAGFEARAGLAAELPIGPLKLRMSGSAAKMWPQELWMIDLTLGVTMSVY